MKLDKVIAATAIGFGALLATVSAAPQARADVAGSLKALDRDDDGTIDLEEANVAASAQFDKLETDQDGTLDPKELEGRLTGDDFTKADPDNDGTISKEEYLAVVEQRFKAADPDNDGTVDEKELSASEGAALLGLLE
jgi:hypothetical protein